MGAPTLTSDNADSQAGEHQGRPLGAACRTLPDRTALAASLLLILSTGSVPHIAHAGEISAVRVGFDGSYKVGRWTPIEVDVTEADDEPLDCEVIVPDSDGNMTIAPLAEIAPGPGGVRRCSGIFRIGRLTAPVRVRAGADTRVLFPSDEALEARPATQSVCFTGFIGSSELGAKVAKTANVSTGGGEAMQERVRAIPFPDWEALPPRGRAWDALDVLFVSGDFPQDTEQSDAVEDWVRHGGHLVLAVGNRSDTYHSSPLSRWVPAGIGESRPVRELATIADRVPGASALPPAVGVRVAQLDAPNGEVLISSFEGPLAARFAYGFGRVTVLAFDYSTPPLRDWDGVAKLCLWLADVRNELPEEDSAQSHLSSNGISDLATQLISNLDWFPAAATPSYGTVLAIVGCFLIIIAPVDYLLVHRLLKRPRYTWITFPVAVLLAAMYGAVIAHQRHPQTRLVNRLDIVDIDVAQTSTRVRSWATLYSPKPSRQSVAFALGPWIAAGEDDHPRVTWSGKPEPGYRGMYRPGGLDLASASYDFSPEYRAIDNLPIDQWSTKSLAAEWDRSAEAVPVRSSLRDDGTGRLTGTITHEFPGQIVDWMLAYGNYVYLPTVTSSRDVQNRVPPGVPWEPAAVDPVPRILKNYLIGQHSVRNVFGDAAGGKGTGLSSRNYDPLNRDPLNLIRMITFHKAAGGRSYTGLDNFSFARSDFSSLLSLHRAVLFGRVSGNAMQFAVDGEAFNGSDSSTFVRIVLPVERSSAVETADSGLTDGGN